MRLFFVRHGQSENNALWLNTGTRDGRKSDPLITAIGRQQIEHTARFLDYCLTLNGVEQSDPSLAFEPGDIYLYCSLMERAVQTGEIISNQLNVKLRALIEIHESGGIYHHDPVTDEQIGDPGKSRSYFQRRYPNLILPKDFDEKGWWNRNYEQRDERVLRAEKVIRILLDNHEGTPDNVIFISHAGFYNYFMRSLLKKEMNRDLWFEFFNGAVSLFHFQEGAVRIYFANRYEFIPVEIVT